MDSGREGDIKPPLIRIVANLSGEITQRSAVDKINRAIDHGADMVRAGIALDSEGKLRIVDESNSGKWDASKAPLLEDILQKFVDIPFNACLLFKNRKGIGALLTLLHSLDNPEMIVVSSAYGAVAEKVKAGSPAVKTASSIMNVVALYALFRFGIISLKKKFPYDIIQTPESVGSSYIASQGFIRVLRQRGFPVQVYVDDSRDMIARLYDSGATGFITSNPAFVARVITGDK